MPTTPWRLAVAATTVSMTLGQVAPVMAEPPAVAVQSQVSPPGRVGRLAHDSGSVAFHTADQTTWSPAILNYPITTGNALWTEQSAEAVVEISGNRLAMDGATEFDVATLDDHALVASTPQGEVYLSLRSVPNGDSYTIQTPRGAVQITAVGRYEIIAGDTDHPTLVTVVEGAAQITGANLALQVNAGQMASIDGSTGFQGVVGPMRPDAFLTKMLAQERPAARSAVAVPAVVAQMTGCEDLDQYGAWSDTPQNGAVWYPRVDSGWVPYRHGRWSYVAPWGWTWVDDAPWGFAPFHYGRWIQTDERWGWVPADPGVAAYPRPVYAPALVSWVDIGAAAAIGVAAGALLGDRSVGWVPLGPNEPYYPPYSHALNYVRTMNAPNIRNVNQVITVNTVTIGSNNRTVVQNFVNRGGATIVPAAVMARSAPIAAAAHPLAPEQFTQFHAQFVPPVRPNATTIGVTPGVARQFNFAAPAGPNAAGPAINPAAFRPVPRGGAPGFVPALRPANVAGAPVPPPGSPGLAGGPAPGGEPQRPPGVPPRGPGGPVAGVEPGHATAAPDIARPGVLPALRQATPPGGEPARPPGLPPAGEPLRPVEPGRPGGPPERHGEPGRAAEAGRPGIAAAPGAATQPPRDGVPGRPAFAPPSGGLRAAEPNRAASPGLARPNIAPPAAGPRGFEPSREAPPRPFVHPAPPALQPHAPAPPMRAAAPPPHPASAPRPVPPPHAAPPPRPAPPARPAPGPHPGPREERR